MALLCLAVSLPARDAVAQQKQQVSIKIPAENVKYGLQQNVVVGDAPNHIVRVFEVHYTVPTNAQPIRVDVPGLVSNKGEWPRGNEPLDAPILAPALFQVDA